MTECLDQWTLYTEPCPYICRNPVRQSILEAILESHPSTLALPTLTTTPAQLPATLAALLDRISADQTGAPTAMLRVTAAHLECYVGAPATEPKFDTVHAALPGFANFLAQSKRKSGGPLARNSVRSHANYARILLRLARELGWSRTPSPAELAWHSVLGTAHLPKGCAGLGRFAVARGRAA